MMPMPAIFISYRRDDSEGQAGRLYDDLIRQFGDGSVFMDVAGIDPGLDFRKVIDTNVSSCGVLLAVIGPAWLCAKDETGQRRLDNPLDFVRLETTSALNRDIPVVPVLVAKARMPSPEQLPEELKELAYRNGIELTHARWDSDLQVLVKALQRHMGNRPPDGASISSTDHGQDRKMGKTTGAAQTEDAGTLAPVPGPHRGKNVLIASIAGWLVLLAVLASVLGPSRIMGQGMLALPAILAIGGIGCIVFLRPRPPKVRAGVLALTAVTAICAIDRLVLLQRPSQFKFSALILVMLAILGIVWIILVLRWPILPVVSAGLLTILAVMAVGWLIPPPKQPPVNIVTSSFQANGRGIGPLANGQPAQYTGPCPVDLKFGWNMASALAAEVSYKLVVGANGQDVYVSDPQRAHLPGNNIPVPISQGLLFKTNTETGWAQILSPGLSSPGIFFIIHCTQAPRPQPPAPDSRQIQKSSR